jgi:GT2 family glycosyltransferase
MNKKLIFIFVHHNNSNLVKSLIESIEYMNDIKNFEIHIADSGSRNEELNYLKNINKIFSLHQFENLGYFNCINKVLEIINKDNSYIVIGNEDLIFDINFYNTFRNNILSYQKYELICPSLITIDGVSQNPHVIKSIKLFRKFVYNLYYSYYPLARLIMFITSKSKLFKRNDTRQNFKSGLIHMCHGSCFILTPYFLKYFNFILAPEFLCHEEAFLRKQLNLINGRIYFDSSLIVNHYDNTSCKKFPKPDFWKISSKSFFRIKNVI